VHRARVAGVLGGYVMLSVAFFGVPVLRAPGAVALGSGKYPDDPSLFMWMLAWWPHALQHGLDPLMTRILFAPEGLNLMWTTSIPGPSLAVAPITVLAGPVVAFNALALLAPALNAFAAFLLCRHVTGRLWPSVAGGSSSAFPPTCSARSRAATCTCHSSRCFRCACCWCCGTSTVHSAHAASWRCSPLRCSPSSSSRPRCSSPSRCSGGWRWPLASLRAISGAGSCEPGA
jgi:hypothetical protein